MRSARESRWSVRSSRGDGRVKPSHDGERWLAAALTSLIAVLLLSLATHAFAVEPSERLADPKLEARAEAIGRTLRCLVCQNESIEESNASLAHDIRVLLRQLLLKGDTDAQARQAIVARYGEFVLLNPPVQPATYVLWYGPVVLLVAGFAGVVLWLRYRWRESVATPPPLSPQEESRLDTLLREADR
ncbi:MAG TPA: cytochrome c-type biogenesis protein [Acetobacteraceae bacterium]|nr:cytochrome c-type biogenesis protein [Acetobacteraceae bacterium]